VLLSWAEAVWARAAVWATVFVASVVVAAVSPAVEEAAVAQALAAIVPPPTAFWTDGRSLYAKEALIWSSLDAAVNEIQISVILHLTIIK